MAPLCADPRQVVIALNPARRQALQKLVEEITAYMSFRLVIPPEELGSVGDDASSQSSGKEGEDKDRRKQSSSPAASQQSITRVSRKAELIQEAAIMHLQEWKKEFLPKLQEIVRVEDTAKIKEERKTRQEEMAKRSLDTAEEGEELLSFSPPGTKPVTIDKSEDVRSLQKLYHPIPTRLTTIPAQDRREALSCVLLLLLSMGKYSAHSRALVMYLASALEIPQTFVNNEEAEIAESLMNSSKEGKKGGEESMSAEAEAEKRREKNKFSRFWKVGLASVAGATIIGVTGGLAAPLVAGAVGSIMGGVGLGGVASFLGIFWMNGALVGALFGAYGAKMTGELMDKYAKEVEDFKFIPLQEEWGTDFRNQNESSGAGSSDANSTEARRLRVTIGVNGWLNSPDDVKKPWRSLDSATEVFALRYEMKTLLELGTALTDLVKSVAWKTLKIEIIKRTVLATLFAALWPIQIISAASNIDNPFSRASNRSKKAGRLLADALINKVQGERPVTLIGYSLGATAIHSCLELLAERKAFGLVETVVIIGTPAPSEAAHWRTLRSVVSGTIFNVFSENDMMLGFVYRMHSLSRGVAGLQAIEGVDGIENLDLSHQVSGHLRYPDLTGEILHQCGFLGVHAGSNIEKDDVIKMKDEHTEGKLVDVDAAAQDKPQPRQQGSTASRKQSNVADDLRGLTISPPALSPQPTEQDEGPPPPLPSRPVDVSSLRKPVPSSPRHQMSRLVKDEDEDDFDREPQLKEPWQTTKRPDTPDSNDGDDREYGMAINMQDNDSDDDATYGHGGHSTSTGI